MASLKYLIPSGTSELLYKENHYTQVVRIPGTPIVKLSGQGGWDSQKMDIDADDVEKQVELAFKNVELMLQHAGLKGWEDVYLQRTYHVGIERSLKLVTEKSRKYCPNHAPVWTAIEVPKLGDPRMLIEIEVEAYDASQK